MTHRRSLRLQAPLDLRATLRPHVRGPGDPTMRLAERAAIRATRTPDGPVAVELRVAGDELQAEAWGFGAERVLDGLPSLVGLDDDPAALIPHHPVVAELARRFVGVRIGRTGAVMEALVPAILEQKVTGLEAFRAFRGLVRAYGEPAPGPLGLWLQPAPEVLAALPYHAFHPLGVEQRRADTIRRAATRAPRLEALAGVPSADAQTGLRSITGIGPWTAAEVAFRAFGDPDAVSVGDFHLPSLVAWALAGEPSADDARMLELLEPYRGQRGRVIRLIEASGLGPPRRGPRMAPRAIAGI